MDEKYIRNIPAVSAEEQKLISQSRVLIAGCGGLGGYLCEYAVRLGVGDVTAADGDSFELSNANRQLLCTQAELGANKAEAAKRRAEAIDGSVRFTAVPENVTRENAERLVRGMTVVLDALDSAEARTVLAEACSAQGVPLVHGAISSWIVQISTVLPGSGTMEILYPGGKSAETNNSVLSFVPAYCAAVQTAEAVRLMCGRKPEFADKLYVADLEKAEQYTITLL